VISSVASNTSFLRKDDFTFYTNVVNILFQTKNSEKTKQKNNALSFRYFNV
jgi:hypothetical protein